MHGAGDGSGHRAGTAARQLQSRGCGGDLVRVRLRLRVRVRMKVRVRLRLRLGLRMGEDEG